MKKPIIILIVLLVAAVVIVVFATKSATQSVEGTVQQIQADTTNLAVNAEIGKQFAIHLKSNPTTGFSWDASFASTSLELVNGTFVPAEEGSAGELVGAGGEEIFTFKALEPGETKITFSYSKKWESVQPLDTRIYTVTIAGESPKAEEDTENQPEN